jgi:predicted HAD superfamily Cof-like phosphohydrolase
METKNVQPRSAVAENTRAFHQAFGLRSGIDMLPGKTDLPLLDLRVGLIAEEFTEVFEAVQDLKRGLYVKASPERIKALREHVLKELADLVYVTYGFADTYGFDLDEANARVHASNMSKLGADGKPMLRADGKVMKGPNYTLPDLSDLV